MCRAQNLPQLLRLGFAWMLDTRFAQVARLCLASLARAALTMRAGERRLPVSVSGQKDQGPVEPLHLQLGAAVQDQDCGTRARHIVGDG